MAAYQRQVLDGAIFPDDGVKSNRALNTSLLGLRRIDRRDLVDQVRGLNIAADPDALRLIAEASGAAGTAGGKAARFTAGRIPIWTISSFVPLSAILRFMTEMAKCSSIAWSAIVAARTASGVAASPTCSGS